MTRAKLQILSLKSKNNQKNEVNSFKKKYNPVNLNIYNYNSKKIDNMSNRLQQILTTETNENNHYGLPYIRLKDTESIFNSLLSTRQNKNSDNYNNTSINIRKTKDENNFPNYNKSPLKYEPKTNQENNSEQEINSNNRKNKILHLLKIILNLNN